MDNNNNILSLSPSLCILRFVYIFNILSLYVYISVISTRSIIELVDPAVWTEGTSHENGDNMMARRPSADTVLCFSHSLYLSKYIYIILLHYCIYPYNPVRRCVVNRLPPLNAYSSSSSCSRHEKRWWRYRHRNFY